LVNKNYKCLMKGKLLIFSGPSGSGKTTLVHQLLRTIPDLKFSISVTSRKKRKNEQEGSDYYFVSSDDFRKKIANGEFIEWEEVYEDLYYGTLRAEVESLLMLGKHVIFDVDVEGGLNIKKQFGEKALAVFIKAPSLEILEERLRLRSTEDELSFRKRIEKAKKEISYTDKFDVVLINENLDESCENAIKLVKNFLEK
jgi:guanylate kinase